MNSLPGQLSARYLIDVLSWKALLDYLQIDTAFGGQTYLKIDAFEIVYRHIQLGT